MTEPWASTRSPPSETITKMSGSSHRILRTRRNSQRSRRIDTGRSSEGSTERLPRWPGRNTLDPIGRAGQTTHLEAWLVSTEQPADHCHRLISRRNITPKDDRTDQATEQQAKGKPRPIEWSQDSRRNLGARTHDDRHDQTGNRPRHRRPPPDVDARQQKQYSEPPTEGPLGGNLPTSTRPRMSYGFDTT